MKSIEKNRKQRFTYLPINIKLVAKLALVALGFYVWGAGFIWALAGLYLVLPILRGILSCLLTLGVVFALIFILFSFL